MRVSGSGVHWCADMDGDECKEREKNWGAGGEHVRVCGSVACGRRLM